MFLLVTYAIYIKFIDDKANCIIFVAQSLEHVLKFSSQLSDIQQVLSDQ